MPWRDLRRRPPHGAFTTHSFMFEEEVSPMEAYTCHLGRLCLAHGTPFYTCLMACLACGSFISHIDGTFPMDSYTCHWWKLHKGERPPLEICLHTYSHIFMLDGGDVHLGEPTRVIWRRSRRLKSLDARCWDVSPMKATCVI